MGRCRVRYDTKHLQALLRARYPEPHWLLLLEVPTLPGPGARRADALALGLGERSGAGIEGFEIKSHRGDWLRELGMPGKSESAARYCDRWWLVLSAPEIVRDGELPDGWGLLVPRGKRLVALQQAARRAPEPPSREFLSALLPRILAETRGMGERNEDYERGFANGFAQRARTASLELRLAEKRLETLQQTITRFEETSGLRVEPWRGQRVGEAVRLVLSGGMREYEQRLRLAHHSLTRLAEQITRSLDEQSGDSTEIDRGPLQRGRFQS